VRLNPTGKSSQKSKLFVELDWIFHVVYLPLQRQMSRKNKKTITLLSIIKHQVEVTQPHGRSRLLNTEKDGMHQYNFWKDLIRLLGLVSLVREDRLD
jgi:hypothetical protein